jgi:hypothetical protein
MIEIGTWGSNVMMRVLLFWLACAAALSLSAGESPPAAGEDSYVWKNTDVLRFDYSKTIVVQQPDADGKMSEQTTDVAAVMILEIKSVSAAGTSAVLRFDSPRVTLPELTMFLAQSEKPESQLAKSRATARAAESAIKAARWNVVLASNGMIHIESRNPASLREWLKETENAAGWRKRAAPDLIKLVEQDLGLRVPANDRDIFIYTGAADPAPAKGADTLRPQRGAVKVSVKEDDKTTLAFTRLAPREKTPYSIPGLMNSEVIEVSLQNVTSQEGQAILDHRLGLLDTLDEDFTATLHYDYKDVGTLKQKVRVKYHLRRLAPAITSK